MSGAVFLFLLMSITSGFRVDTSKKGICGRDSAGGLGNPTAVHATFQNVTDSNPGCCCSMVTSRAAADRLPLFRVLG